MQEENWDQSALSIVVVGASGDLAKKKIFPALFALYYEKMLPRVRPWVAERVLLLCEQQVQGDLRW